MQTAAVSSLEYRNDFFSIDIQESENRPGSYIFSSGVSLPKFNPIIWGRTGICSNAAFKGLQQLRADVSFFALQRGIATSDAGIPAASGHGDGWYQESSLLIEDASPEVIKEILAFSARDLVQTILTACDSNVKVQDGLDPAATQRLLESVSIPNYKEMAPPPIAKQKAA
ncbi:MAG: hypothetical protein OEW15_04440 [Nitrospirota bacterium]|nr:hypothetical protein [Nitrospirota bacterium]